MVNLIFAVFFCPMFRNYFIIINLCLILSILTGCQTAKDLNPWGSYPVPRCPKTQLLKDTDIITAYRLGLGRDITDIRYEAEIKSFEGSCEYIGKKGLYSEVKLNIKVKFNLIRGPATQSRFIEFSYFVAIPEFYPKPAGQQIFTVKAKFPENRNSINITDEEVEISIPLKKSRKGPEIEIYIGFQLTSEQIENNRKKRQTPRLN